MTAAPEKTEDELMAERQTLAEKTAAVDREIAARKLVKVQAFAEVLAAPELAQLLQSAKEAAAQLSDNAASYATNFITALEVAPQLMANEIDRLRIASMPPAPMPTAPASETPPTPMPFVPLPDKAPVED